MHTFRKIGSDWCVQLADGSEQLVFGTEITVTLRDGRNKQVTLGEYVGQQYGRHVYKVAPTARPAAQAATNVGDLTGIITLFDRARTHLRYPAIVLMAGNETIKIKMAGTAARVPGSLNVVSADREVMGRPVWFGRVLRNGTYEPSASTDAALATTIAAVLRAFAADPARVAGEHGRLHGHCCFCRKRLTDERSTLVGYGPDCAGHYGLPWGDRPADFASAAPAPRRSRRAHWRRSASGTTTLVNPPLRLDAFRGVEQRLPLEPAPAATPTDTTTEPQRYDDVSAATRLEDSER